MSDMKCPICGTILDKAFINDKIRGCPKCRNITGRTNTPEYNHNYYMTKTKIKRQKQKDVK